MSSNQKSQKSNATAAKPAIEPSATYAIDGLTEYLLRIPIGTSRLEFHFTGGLLSGYGVRPATLTLSDPIRMRFLENSRQFKNGLIRKI